MGFQFCPRLFLCDEGPIAQTWGEEEAAPCTPLLAPRAANPAALTGPPSGSLDFGVGGTHSTAHTPVLEHGSVGSV